MGGGRDILRRKQSRNLGDRCHRKTSSSVFHTGFGWQPGPPADNTAEMWVNQGISFNKARSTVHSGRSGGKRWGLVGGNRHRGCTSEGFSRPQPLCSFSPSAIWPHEVAASWIICFYFHLTSGPQIHVPWKETPDTISKNKSSLFVLQVFWHGDKWWPKQIHRIMWCYEQLHANKRNTSKKGREFCTHITYKIEPWRFFKKLNRAVMSKQVKMIANST